jgi:hypothetical protein
LIPVRKTVFIGIETLKLCIKDPIITFSEGAVGRTKVVEKLGMPVEENMKNIL